MRGVSFLVMLLKEYQHLVIQYHIKCCIKKNNIIEVLARTLPVVIVFIIIITIIFLIKIIKE